MSNKELLICSGIVGAMIGSLIYIPFRKKQKERDAELLKETEKMAKKLVREAFPMPDFEVLHENHGQKETQYEKRYNEIEKELDELRDRFYELNSLDGEEYTEEVCKEINNILEKEWKLIAEEEKLVRLMLLP